MWNYLYGIKYDITVLEKVKLMTILITCERVRVRTKRRLKTTSMKRLQYAVKSRKMKTSAATENN